MLSRKRPEKKIDRRPLPARLVERGDREMMVGRTKLPVGRDDIDVARFHGREAGNLGHRHFRPSGQNVGELALAPRIEMHDDNEGGVDVVGETFEKHLQGVNAPGGRSDAHRWKSLGGLGAAASIADLVHLTSQLLRPADPAH